MVRLTNKDHDHLTDIERAIEAEVRNRPPIHEPTPAAPPSVIAPAMAMPDYVEHSEGATEIGKLSAEAIVREYEIAAKAIEAMGTELINLARQCEAMTRNAFAVNDELKQAAARYRKEAKRVFVYIENCSLLTEKVRKACADLTERIAAEPEKK
jgi:hypothetical protein